MAPELTRQKDELKLRELKKLIKKFKDKQRTKLLAEMQETGESLYSSDYFGIG